jgi:spermidine dehydrogenase
MERSARFTKTIRELHGAKRDLRLRAEAKKLLAFGLPFLTSRPTVMSRRRTNKSSDDSLGLSASICRRDFLNATLLASGAVLLQPLTPLQLLGENGSWGGYTGVGDYADANGNTMEVMQAAHAIRDGAFDSVPRDVINTGETFDMVVVGGGISGLASALFFNTLSPRRSCLVLENHPIFGGESRRNEFIVDGQRLIGPQGANQFGPPAPGSLTDWFYRQVGYEWDFEFQKWSGPGPEMRLSPTSYYGLFLTPPNFGFYFGAQFDQRPGMWLTDPWKNLEKAPFPEPMRSELLKWRNGQIHNSGEAVGELFDDIQRGLSAPSDTVARGRHGGQAPFEHEGDAKSRHLDSITIEDRLVQEHGLSRETIRSFIAPYEAQGYGVGPDALSAYAPYKFGKPHVNTPPPTIEGPYASQFRSKRPNGHDAYDNWKSFPGGNAGLARHIVKTLVPDAIEGPRTLEAICRNRVNFGVLDRPTNTVRIRVGSTAVRVEHEGEPASSDWVWVTYTRAGKTYRLKTRSVVMAGGGWASRRVVRDLPSDHRKAYNQFNYSACLVANVAVRNWRFLHKLGISGGRWFEGLGCWTEVRKIAAFGSDSKTIGPDSPTVLTLYVPLFYPGLPTADQGHRGRGELFSTSFRDYERQIREQFVDMFSRSGFDPQRDIAGIILNRWGHAYVNAQPGFYFGKNGEPAPRDIIRDKAFGRIAFAHTDLTGAPAHWQSIGEAYRAVGQVREAAS